MKRKFLRVTMPDMSQWDIPCEIIAAHRASYYYPDKSNAEYSLEFNHTLEKNGELIDWSANNMNWSDVSAHAWRIEEIPKDFDWQEGWVNGDRKIVE